MINTILDELKGKILDLKFIERYGSIVVPVSQDVEDEDGRSKRITFPASWDGQGRACYAANDYFELAPNDVYRSVSYWELRGDAVPFVPRRGDRGKWYGFRQSARLVVWLNLQVLGIPDTGNKLSDHLSVLAMNALQGAHQVGMDYIDGVRMTVERKVRKSMDIFGPYSYSDRNELLLYPYDFFAIDFAVEWYIKRDCVPGEVPYKALKCAPIEMPGGGAWTPGGGDDCNCRWIDIPDRPHRLSDFENDGDGENPFITANDIPDFVETVGGSDGVEVDDTDPQNPIAKLTQASKDSLQKADSAVQPGDLADVATSGEFGDLLNVPDFIEDSEKGVNNGVATLDGGGKIPAGQLPNSVMTLEGPWDASTNTPALQDGTGNAGMVYEVTVAGTQDLGSGNISFDTGDFVVYGNDGKWYRSINSNEVVSVNGQTGVVLIGFSHLTSHPTTLSGYGILDAATAAQGAKADSALQPGDLPPPQDLQSVTDAGNTTTNPVKFKNAYYNGFNSYEVEDYFENTNNIQGAIVIRFGDYWMNAMLKLDISLFDRRTSTEKALNYTVSGYAFGNGSAWLSTSAGVYGSSTLVEVPRIRFASYGDNRRCIIIGSSTSIWSRPHVSISKLENVFSPIILDSISIERVTDESEFTNIVEPPLNQNISVDMVDGYHASEFALLESEDISPADWVLDEDNMVSNSDTKVPTQQSVKAYVDANAGGDPVNLFTDDLTLGADRSHDLNQHAFTIRGDMDFSNSIMLQLTDGDFEYRNLYVWPNQVGVDVSTTDNKRSGFVARSNGPGDVSLQIRTGQLINTLSPLNVYIKRIDANETVEYGQLEIPEYASDTDADNDANLASGAPYSLTGDRTVYRKP